MALPGAEADREGVDVANDTREQVDALLADAEEQMAAVRSLYDTSLTEKQVIRGLQVRIKNVLENQRSALEYVAHAVVVLAGGNGSRCYFPVLNEPGEFTSA